MISLRSVSWLLCLGALSAHAGDKFKFQKMGFDSTGTRFGYWLSGKDPVSSQSHAEFHVVSLQGDAAFNTPDRPGEEDAALFALRHDESKKLSELALNEEGFELFDSGSSVATTLNPDGRHLGLRLSIGPGKATPQPMELILTQGTPEVLFAGAEGHGYTLSSVLRPRQGEVIVIIYKLSAEKTDLREYRVVMASTAAHQISPSKRPRLVGAPMITSVEIAKTLSREETRDQFAQASDLTAKVIVQGKPGETCSGKATAIFEIAPDGSEKPRRETVRKDVTLTFDAAGQASFDLSASFDPPLMCSTFKVTVSGGCPQLVSFTARDFLACGI